MISATEGRRTVVEVSFEHLKLGENVPRRSEENVPGDTGRQTSSLLINNLLIKNSPGLLKMSFISFSFKSSQSTEGERKSNNLF